MTTPKQIKLNWTPFDQYLTDCEPFICGDSFAYQFVLPGKAGQTLLVTAEKPNGDTNTDYGEYLNGWLRYTVKNNMYNVPGESFFEISLIGENGEVLTAVRISVTVREGIAGLTVNADNSLNVLQTMIEQTQQAGNYAREQAAYVRQQAEVWADHTHMGWTIVGPVDVAIAAMYTESTMFATFAEYASTVGYAEEAGTANALRGFVPSDYATKAYVSNAIQTAITGFLEGGTI